MQDINKTFQIGRLVSDAVLSYTQGGAVIIKFSLANSESYKKGEQWEEWTNFFDVVAFGPRWEKLASYLVKGKQVAVEGKLKQDRWEKDGTKRSKVMIKAMDIQLLGSKEQKAKPEQQKAYPNKAGYEDDIPWA